MGRVNLGGVGNSRRHEDATHEAFTHARAAAVGTEGELSVSLSDELRRGGRHRGFQIPVHVPSPAGLPPGCLIIG